MPTCTVALLLVILCFTTCRSSDECKFHDPVTGTHGTGWFSKGFCHFLGIPYALPPVGVKQFQDPKGTDLCDYATKFWNFTKRSDNCIQYDFESSSLTGSEDCLYLNIYTTPWMQHLKPVVVWIHGGTFNFGSGFSDLAEFPDLFVTNNITVVTVNYRLGPLGYLYREGEDLTRNAGLKDQQEALRWIQRNIHHFGGDPTQVTIMGWSAGGAAVSYHLYDPTSAGLFTAAIIMSGTFLNPWAYSPSTEICLSTMCNQMEISCKNPQHLREILTKAKIEQTQPLFTLVAFFGMRYPCFVPSGKLPQLLITSKPPIDVPLLIGFTSQETLKQIELNYMESTLSNYVFPNPSHLHAIEDFVRTTLTESNLTDVLVAADLIYGVIKFSEEYTKKTKSDTFLYKFSVGDANHGDELPFIFRDSIHKEKMNEKYETTKEDLTTSARIIQLWSNFIKFKHPTPAPDPLNIQWKPFTSYDRLYLNIDHQLMMTPFKEDSAFIMWDGIYQCLYYGNCTNAPY